MSKYHKVESWDGPTACGYDSGKQDLDQAIDWDLVNCKKCLKKKKEA